MSSFVPATSRSSRRVRPRQRAQSLTPVQQILKQSIDWGMMGAIFAVPLFMGGRLALGKVVLVTAVSWMAISWSWLQCSLPKPRYTPTKVEPLLLIAAILVWLQCVPWPAEYFQKLLPDLKTLLPLWNASGASGFSMGEWNTISFTPAVTREILVIFLAYALLFLVTAQRIETTSDIEEILKKVAGASMLMAAFGLAQYYAGNGKYFWTYEHPILTTTGSVKGSFTNGNHFSHFVVLGVGPILWWMLNAAEPERKRKRGSNTSPGFQPAAGQPLLVVLLLGGLGVVGLAVLMALSRGGAVVMMFSLLVVLGICYQRKYVSGKILAGLIGSGLLAGAGLWMYGLDQVSENLDDWSTGRWLIWQANWEVFQEFPLLGTGLGSHAEAYQNHLDLPLFEKKFSHAESGYMQILSETGIVGISLLAVVLLVPLYWCLRGLGLAQSRRSVTIFAAILGSILANYIHAIVDFIWWVPGCMVILLVLAACACRQYQITRAHHDPERPETFGTVPRLIAWSMCGMLIFTGYWMGKSTWSTYQAEKKFHEYQRLPELVLESKNVEELREAAMFRLTQQLELLVSAVKHNPNDAHLHLRLARAYRGYFQYQQANSDNPMSVSQIADAVYASKFANPQEANDWLNRAIGDNMKYLRASHFHTRQALRLCPLLGDGYAALSLTLFLEKPDELALEECLMQAFAVRPYDADVLFAIGAQYWKKTQYKEAAFFWKRAFQREARLQKRIIKLVTGVIPAQLIINLFEPNREALQRLRDRHRSHGNPEDLKIILAHYAFASQKLAEESINETATRAWLQAHVSFNEIGQLQRAEHCIREALTRQPNEYRLRAQYANWLSSHQRNQEALELYEWCLRINPQDQKLMQRYQLARKNRFASRPAADSPN